MNHQHVENLLIRYRGQAVDVKTISGGVYEGSIVDVTNDYVALKLRDAAGAGYGLRYAARGRIHFAAANVMVRITKFDFSRYFFL